VLSFFLFVLFAAFVVKNLVAANGCAKSNRGQSFFWLQTVKVLRINEGWDFLWKPCSSP
jgi:hypothetical protein